MPNTIETQNGFKVYVSFSFSLSLFLMWVGSHWRKMLCGPRLQLVHIQKPDHPPSISHESHPKLDPHTHHNNALNSNKELKKGRDNHTFALGATGAHSKAKSSTICITWKPPKIRPAHTSQQCFKFQQRTNKKERQSHIYSWRFRKQHFYKAFFFGCICCPAC
jgi:hypothetical protein